MPDMNNLRRLRNSVTKAVPDLPNRLVDNAPQRTKPLMPRVMIPTLSASLAVLGALLFSSNGQYPALPPAAQVKPTSAENYANGLFTQNGVTFRASKNLGIRSGVAEVWALRATSNFKSSIENLALTLGYKQKILSGLTTLQGTGSPKDTLSVRAQTGYWQYLNIKHGMSIDGFCQDTMARGKCLIPDRNLGDATYREKAVKLFTAGGWRGEFGDLRLRNDGNFITVTTSHKVAANRFALDWTASWFADGTLSSASGFISSVESLGRVAILSPKDSVARADDYRQWTASAATTQPPSAPIISKQSVTVENSDYVYGFINGFIVPSFRLSDNSGAWFRQVNAIENWKDVTSK